MKEERNKKTIISKFTNVILNILIGIFSVILVISIYMGFQIKILKNDYSNFFGYTFFETQTGSMRDEINPGDWIVVKITKDVEIKDVVTYKQDDDFITHRIIEAYKGTYVTKGDANNTKDEPIDESQIIGKVVKVLPNFGIIRKTIFNQEVILALIIVIFAFNLCLKEDEENSKLEKAIKNLGKKVIGKFKKNGSHPEYSEEEIKQIEEILNAPIENEEETSDDTLTGELVKEDAEKAEEVKSFEKETTLEVEVVEEEKEDIDDEDDDDIDDGDELSKTSVYRIISVEKDDVEQTKKKPKRKTTPKETKKEEPKEEEKIVAKEVEPKKRDTGVNNYKTKKKNIFDTINLDGLKEKIAASKAPNMVDKAIKIKESEVTEILELLLKDQLEYVKKSTLKDDFVREYIYAKFYDIDSFKSTKKIKEHIELFSSELLKKYVRDENQQKVIKAYGKAIYVIAIIDSKSKNNSKENNVYEEIISRNYDFDEEYVRHLAHSIEKIQKNCLDMLNESMKKMDTSMFVVNYKKLTHRNDLYAASLEHNISFSKIYSDYIVDKTYNEGIIAEDKIEVLITMLARGITDDIMASEYNKMYMVYLPTSLYEKEKKIEGLLQIIDNQYVKNHMLFATDVANLVKLKKTTNKIKKKGFRMVGLIDDDTKANYKDLTELYLAEYFIADRRINAGVIKQLPKEVQKKVIKDDMKKIKEI